jgi:hypothetical protein
MVLFVNLVIGSFGRREHPHASQENGRLRLPKRDSTVVCHHSERWQLKSEKVFDYDQMMLDEYANLFVY